ncbi:preprotein translocase subunit SecE [Kiritimatiella glycovorans]|uniref:Protein translocase subunit SecE n=1 Tax=Kiritimatiella glycovorans TaxID=1307763 RepID=A0A0G3ELF9_9BACT|nr:preprotein translocase subunit SecE [Kiritimatiella glycovorans]AKJ64969.1 Preprotein translocase subunit SecE [Kiritimatiella glycovorans]
MKRVFGWVEKLRTYLTEVRAELKKCAWPSRRELAGSTGVVLLTVALLGVFVGLSDTVLMWAIRLVLR